MKEDFEKYANNIPVILYRCRLSPKREIVFINNAIESLIGADQKEVLMAKGLASLTYSEDLIRIDTLINSAETGQGYDAAYRVIDSKGNIHWVKDEFSVIEENGIQYMDGCVRRDATWDQTLATARTRQLYQSLFENEFLGVTIGPPRSEFTRVNQAFCRLIGYSRQELLQMKMVDISFKEDIPASKDWLKQIVNKEISSFKMKKRYRGKNGRCIYSETSVFGIFDSKGTLIETVAVVNDITDYKDFEQKIGIKNELLVNQKKVLEKSNAQLTQALQELKDAQNKIIQSEKMASLGALVSGVAHEINTPLAAIGASSDNIGNTLENLIGQWATSLKQMDEEEIGMLVKLVNYSAVQERVLPSREERKLKKEYNKELVALEVESPEIISDAFINMRIYDGLENWTSIFNVSAAHAIIQVASGISNLFHNNTNINNAVKRASKIILALRKFSFHGADDKMVELSIIDTLETVLTIYDYQIKKINLEKNFIDDLVIKGYADELAQVWTNLLHNALQAIEFNGYINISTQKVDNLYEVCITDNGPGVPAKSHDKIFKAFFTTKTIGEGNGLGLSIAKDILEKHNATIRLDTDKNDGARFIVNFFIE